MSFKDVKVLCRAPVWFSIRIIFSTLLSCSIWAAQDNSAKNNADSSDAIKPRVVLLAEKNTSALNKLLTQLKSTSPDYLFQVSTADRPIAIPREAYVIVVGAKPPTHVDIAKYPNSIVVMLTAEQAKTLTMATSIYIEPPLSRQLKLANLLIPGNKKIGLLVSNQQDKERVLSTLDDTEQATLKVVAIDEYDNINQALFHVLKNTRLLLGQYNNEIYSAQNIKNILITSYRQRKVLIGPSRAYLKAGSFSTTFSNLTHIAQRIIEIVKHHEATGEWIKADYNPHYRILFNSQVARSLNIRVLKEDVLLQQMGDH